MLNGVVDTERPGETTLVCGFTPQDLDQIRQGNFRIRAQTQKGLPIDVNLVLVHGDTDQEIETFLRSMGSEGELSSWQQADAAEPLKGLRAPQRA